MAIKERFKTNCAYCEKELELQQYRLKENKSGRFFCNQKCKAEWQKDNPEYKNYVKAYMSKKKVRKQIKCDECDKTFEKIPSEINKTNFCCRECYLKYSQKYPNRKKETVYRHCSYCEKEMKIKNCKQDNKNMFCSRECYERWYSDNLVGENNPHYRRIKIPCDYCEKEIEVTPFDLRNSNHHFCSKECDAKYRSENYSGENHSQYGTKKTPEQIEKMRIRTVKCYADGVFNRQTSIQKTVNNVLSKLNIKFTNEHPFKYYAVDNYLTEHNLVIEVMGDYFHVNPTKYNSLDSLSKIQSKSIPRDKRKRTYLKKYYGVTILYLWESDIRNSIDLCVDLIMKFIKQNGQLDDYNSFNYEFSDEQKINIKNEVINPYFLR